MSYLSYSLRNHTEAEDLFQDTMIRAHGDWDRVQTMERPEAWVFRVARNLMINRKKRKQTERKVLAATTPEQEPGAISSVERNEIRKEVQGALADLPEDQREAVCMKVWGQCTWVEIGSALGTSEDTAARLFARGLKAIAPRLKGLQP